MFMVERLEDCTMAKLALSVMRSFFKLASAVAPVTTGNAAFTRFCRPPKADGLEPRQKAMIVKARDRLKDAKQRDIPHKGGTIRTYWFQPHNGTNPQGNVLLLHGWTGRSEFLTAFVDPLRKQGFNVVLMDMPAHGHSSGRVLNLVLAVDALMAVYRETGPWSGIIAHSFGGAVATAFITGALKGSAAVPVDRLVMVASPNAMRTVFSGFSKTIGLGKRAQEALNANVERLSGRSIDALVCGDLLRSTHTKVLCLHAPDDKEVPFSEAEALAAAGPFVTLMPLPGLGHRRILYAPVTVTAATRFVAGEKADTRQQAAVA
jgi:pimeloyl-ACP methyl ester carboxylesterase